MLYYLYIILFFVLFTTWPNMSIQLDHWKVWPLLIWKRILITLSSRPFKTQQGLNSKNLPILVWLTSFYTYISNKLLITVDSKKSETLEKMTALSKHVFDTCRHYWVDHKPKFFWNSLDLGGAAIIFPKSGRNQK